MSSFPYPKFCACDIYIYIYIYIYMSQYIYSFLCLYLYDLIGLINDLFGLIFTNVKDEVWGIVILCIIKIYIKTEPKNLSMSIVPFFFFPIILKCPYIKENILEEISFYEILSWR